eukprot:CAMPEP_0113276766 /NCGR_PEP_ID=MMETSP0008_2-20120614/25670_1 /TAXON_ID=97485 /ORGANISM="Prymnesium parvum" /LENGTH=271 /DNA_ID=CAMNT_0000126593 /DNA_START=133 /DNA_END=945 /DNA_ORIENTATION=- /assembly_acc=CAM_ASM_000153
MWKSERNALGIFRSLSSAEAPPPPVPVEPSAPPSMPDIERLLVVSSAQAMLALMLLLATFLLGANIVRRRRGRRPEPDAMRTADEEAHEQRTQMALDALPVHVWMDDMRSPLNGQKRSTSANDLLQQLSVRFSGRSTTREGEECSLCLQPFTAGEHVTTLPCGHYYHSECISKWFAAKKYSPRFCPLCKRSPVETCSVESALGAPACALCVSADSTARSAEHLEGNGERADAPFSRQPMPSGQDTGQLHHVRSVNATGSEVALSSRHPPSS